MAGTSSVPLIRSTNTRVRCPRTHKRETRKKTKTTEKRHGTHRASAQPTVSMSRATSAPTQRSQPLLLATLAQPPMALSCSSGMNHTHSDHERGKRKKRKEIRNERLYVYAAERANGCRSFYLFLTLFPRCFHEIGVSPETAAPFTEDAVAESAFSFISFTLLPWRDVTTEGAKRAPASFSFADRGRRNHRCFTSSPLRPSRVCFRTIASEVGRKERKVANEET